MKKSVRNLVFTFSAILSLCFFSCEKQDDFSKTLYKNYDIEFKTISKKDHKWYYFNKDGFEQINLPQNVPQSSFKPWTEAIRISSSISIGSDSFMMVNKLGLLSCNPENPKQANLAVDNTIFSDLTATNLTNIDGFPVFHVYKNQEFNNSVFKSSKNQNVNHPFLVEYHPDSSIFIPLLSNSDLNISNEAQVSGIVFDDNEWTVTLKSDDGEKKKFQHYKFFSQGNFSGLGSKQNKDLIQTESISIGEYRSQLTPQDMSKSPERVQELFARLPDNFSYFIECTTPNSGKKESFVQSKDISSQDIMESQVLLGETYSIAIFTDGTGFFTGSLPDRYVITEERPIAFRLPKLPKNFSYGTLIIEGEILYISWEESIFYETGRSGFLTVDLGKVFYEDEEG